MLRLLDNTKTSRPAMPIRDYLRFGEVDLEAPPVDQETMAPSFHTVVSFWHRCHSVAKHSRSLVIHPESCFCISLVVSLMCKLMNLL